MTLLGHFDDESSHLDPFGRLFAYEAATGRELWRSGVAGVPNASAAALMPRSRS